MGKAARIDRVETRLKLKPRRSPYWQRLAKGRYVGYRRLTAGRPGTWLARAYNGEDYPQEPLGDFTELSEGERFDAAKRAAEAWWQHLDKGGSIEKVTVKAACAAYVEKLKMEKSEAAAGDAAMRFKRLIDSDPVGRILLAKLSSRHVADWKARTLARGGTHGSFNRNATALRAALNLSHERRDVASDHAWSVELKPFKNADGQRTLYLKRPARAKFLEKASAELQRFLTVLMMLPLRPGDVAKLRVQDFDPHQKTLSIPLGKTKKRVIPLPNDAVREFKSFAVDKFPSAWLVCRDDSSQWKKEAWREGINEAVELAKLPKATCAYTLRHCAITDLVTGGLDLFTVAKLAGTSIVMIEKNYGHLQNKHARAALAGLSL